MKNDDKLVLKLRYQFVFTGAALVLIAGALYVKSKLNKKEEI